MNKLPTDLVIRPSPRDASVSKKEVLLGQFLTEFPCEKI